MAKQQNTAIYAFVVVPIGLIISMFIAITIFEKIKHKGLCETIFFIPYLTSVIAVGIVFRYLLNGDYGFVNYAEVHIVACILVTAVEDDVTVNV